MIDTVEGCRTDTRTSQDGTSAGQSESPLVDVMVAGAQKAGTTSLLRYLSQHPGIQAHDKMEFGYFCRDEQYAQPESVVSERYYGAGHSSETVKLAKSVAIHYIKESARRLHRHNSDCKIILVLRDPVDRAYSAYWYQRQQGWETESTFEGALAREEERLASGEETARHCGYVDRGRYGEQMSYLQDLFGAGNVHAVRFASMVNNPQAVCNEIFRFIGLEEYEIGEVSTHNKTQVPKSSAVQSAIKQAKRSRLAEALRSTIKGSVVYDALKEAADYVLDANAGSGDVPEMNGETRNRLARLLQSDVRILEERWGRKITEWDWYEPAT